MLDRLIRLSGLVAFDDEPKVSEMVWVGEEPKSDRPEWIGYGAVGLGRLIGLVTFDGSQSGVGGMGRIY